MKSFSITTSRSSFLTALVLGSRLCAARRMPVYSFDPDTIESCIDWWNNSDDSRSCDYVRDLFGITPEQFAEWNPSLSVDCQPWRFPLSYCVSIRDRAPLPDQSTTTISSTTSTSTTSSLVPSPTSWSARGCYPDDDPEYPLLEVMVTAEGGDSSLDIAGCEDMCWKASINGTVLFAGVKAGDQCWCSNFIGGESTRDQEDCSMPCSGADDEICGGKDHINVFEPVTTTSGAPSTATTQTSSSAVTTEAISTTTAQASSSAITTETDSGAARKRAFF